MFGRASAEAEAGAAFEALPNMPEKVE